MNSIKNFSYNPNVNIKSENRFINRELSWISFNRRVLDEANNQNYPMLERLRFLSISGNNLDEFHMVRVAGITRQIRENIQDKSSDGRTPSQQLRDVNISMKELLARQQSIWNSLKEKLEFEGLRIIESREGFKKYSPKIKKIFDEEIFPTLTPLAIDPAHPFPFLPNLSLTLVLSLINKEKKKISAVVTFPQILKRFFKLSDNEDIFISTEDIILLNIIKLFPDFNLQESGLIRVIRDSDIEFEEEAEDLMQSFEVALKKRRLGSVIGLYVKKNIGEKLLNFVKKELAVSEDELFKVKSLLDVEAVSQIINLSNLDLVFKKFRPRFPQRIKDFAGDCFKAIKKKDLVVHHPFETFDVVINFLNQAANDPNVISIKQTLYRTSHNSPIVSALINASINGKSVTAIVELKARFDEEKNIKWAKDLEKAGVQIVYGFVSLKTHAKISMVSRRERNKIVTYTHFGTGNYHPVTAKIYTDLSFFSSNEELGKDSGKIFNFITGSAKPKNLSQIVCSPLSLRSRLVELINEEIAYSKRNCHSEIWMKINSLIDPQIIDALYYASQMGVKIELIVRGICGLRPGIPGLSDNIRVRSIIGRFLEHSRIYCFSSGNKMTSRKVKVYISSADLMTRNLDRRVETFVPILNQTVHEQILDQIMASYLKDNTNSSELKGDGTYEKISSTSNQFSAHDFFLKNTSLSGRGKK
tara:strand:+ start:925 stop:3024 length:2100 start_codon:yes stop_codon:yes gene_type:complete